MANSANSECAHTGCGCGVPDGQRFCSDHCERQSGAGGEGKVADSGCRCSHEACEGAGRVAHG